MPRALTAAQVSALTEDGDWRVERNLYVQVRKQGRSKAWTFRYRFQGRLRRMGLGPVRLFTLSEVRRKVLDAQKLLAEGVDPLSLKRKAKAESKDAPTFDRVARDYINSRKGTWRDRRRAGQWESSLRNHAANLYRLPVDEVDIDLVYAALKPIWGTKPEAAGKLRGRIEAVLDYAIAMKYRPPGPNPAAWRGPLGKLLPPTVRLKAHYQAVPYPEIPALVAALRAKGGRTATALAFVLLTAVRSGELRLATWREMDLQAKTWTIPASRTKTGAEHVVPLSDEAIALLPETGRLDDLVFRGLTRLRPMSDATLLKALRKVRGDESTVHGLRASFRTWAADKTDYAHEVAEAALGHRVGGDVVRAYQRGTFFEKRRELMNDWARFATTPVRSQ